MADDLTKAGIQDAEQAEARFLAGDAGFRPGSKVAIRPRDGIGGIQVVDAAEVRDRLGQGFRLAADDEVRAEADRQEYGEGLGNTALAATAGVARGLSVGASDAVARIAGGQEAADTLRGLREQNPITSTTGEVVGAVAPALFTGGAGGAGAMGTAARFTPAGAVARAGLAGERVAAGALGSTRTARALSQAAAGAVEGALFGAGEGISEAALSEQEVTAERLLLSIGRRAGAGAVLGGLATGGLSGAAGGLGAGKRKAEALAKRLSAARGGGEALEAGARAGAGLEVRAGAKLADGGETATRAFVRKATAARRLAKERDQAAETWIDSVSEMQRAGAHLDDQLTIANKHRVGKRRLADQPAAPDEQVAAAAMTEFRRLEESVADLHARGGELVGTSGQTAVNTLKRQFAEFGASIEDAMRKERGDDLVVALQGVLDNTKRALGRAERRAASGASPNHGVADVIRDNLREPLRFHLEDEAIYGGMGKLQREWNAEWVPRLEQERAYRSLFLQPRQLRTERLPGSVETIALGDSSKLASFANRIGELGTKDAELVFERAIEAQRRFYTRSGELFGKEGQTAALIRKFDSHAEKALERFRSLRKTRADADDFDDMLGFVGDIPKVGDAAAAAAAGFGSLFNLASRAQGISTAQGAADVAARSIAERVKGLGQRIRKGARSARTLLPATAASSVADRYKEVERLYETSREYEDNPQAAVRRVLRTHDLERVAPQLAAAVASRIAVGADVLASKLPAAGRFNVIGADPDALPMMSDDEVDTVLAYARAIEDPLSVVESLEDGRVSFDSVDALRQVYPRMYRDLQDQVIGMLSELDDAPDFDTTVQLGVLFDLPTDSTLDPSYMRLLHANAANYAQQSQQGALSPSRRSAPDDAENYETGSQASARRR